MDVTQKQTRPKPTRFNGAAGVNPRMAAVLVKGIWLANPLQWGRGCEPADGSFDQALLFPMKSLQWGRGCEPADGRLAHTVTREEVRASMGPRV